MESEGNSNLQQKYPTKASSSGMVIDATTNIPTDANTVNLEQIFKRDPDQYMPIANVTRIMRRVLPSNAKIADDAKETIQECVSEFISFVTSEANEKCHKEYRKTITSEDVLSALRTLGFDNYVEPLTIFLNKYRAEDSERNPHPLPFMRHATRYVQQPVVPMAQPPPSPPLPPPSFIMNYGRAQLATTYTMDQTNYVEIPPMNVYKFMGNQGGGEGASSSLEIDAHRPFK
ncbi:hypothetical protein CDL12_21065 [Handroanthus impetiginosus]|uniref:Transcription factor CBF/NF-Y/archaeal histone domain-containing protein n=1 Tax=Handroanthus impetiginosus TaxID=429701 RepID=A0A2G9GM53_9LAMI|nr:hypothetical protein CDL12_21065 [Handroanthus impetiginosus]